MKRSLTILLLLLIIANFCSAQFKKQIDSLSAECERITSDSQKVIALGKLANLYYAFKLNKAGDSVLNKQLLIADLSNNNNLILLALFGDAITNISPTTPKEEFDRTIRFLEKGITYARSQNQYDYIALGYARMANLLRKRGQYENALNYANLALNNLQNIVSDSIKVITYIELGNTYLLRNESVKASMNYNTAFDIAHKINSVSLQSEVYHCYSEMYRMLGHMDIAKEELKKSLDLNKKHDYAEGLVKDYYDLARITDEKSLIDSTIKLATRHKIHKYIIEGKNLMFYYYMVAEKSSEKALAYLEAEPDVKQALLNNGRAYYYRNLGEVYLYAKKPDSALHYLKLAEEDYIKIFDQKPSRGILREIAEAYELKNDYPNAIVYYSKALDLSVQLNDAGLIAYISKALSNLYEKMGDFKLAYTYSKQSVQFQDSLRKLSEGRDIALLNVERENRKHAEELRQEQQKMNNKRNIQYMAITIAIALLFALMLILGMFPISKLTIKMLGYFFFISVFEFIVLLIDTFLHRITHGEPLKIWLIKIFIIALLVPIQHYLEHRMIKFLESRKLLRARSRLSVKYWMAKLKTKKPTPVKEAGFEEETAVL